MKENNWTAENTQDGAGTPGGSDGLRSRKARKSGKPRGWRYLRTAEDVKAAANAIYNSLVVGDTKADLAEGEPPRKMDPQTAHAALSALRCWMEANALAIEKKLQEIIETNEMLLKLLEQRGIDVRGGGGSRSN